ncbi:hypothetical protein SKAU_G00003570 [Synaphobranchus kaupii]|uniref:Uncharacterized protein n=1 Tax=Synaphobranchus kaupii TaxID=118154 RepID=A0A9Q1G8P1_SYNKA|nr:hypothetical protein SKAU_G00003570 [Synaphobranchus kaupii]
MHVALQNLAYFWPRPGLCEDGLYLPRLPAAGPHSIIHTIRTASLRSAIAASAKPKLTSSHRVKKTARKYDKGEEEDAGIDGINGFKCQTWAPLALASLRLPHLNPGGGRGFEFGLPCCGVTGVGCPLGCYGLAGGLDQIRGNLVRADVRAGFRLKKSRNHGAAHPPHLVTRNALRLRRAWGGERGDRAWPTDAAVDPDDKRFHVLPLNSFPSASLRPRTVLRCAVVQTSHYCSAGCLARW